MARQKLIHINSSGTTNIGPSAQTIDFGEIAVNYNKINPRLFIKTKDGNNKEEGIAEFYDAAKITGITEEIKTSVTTLNGTVQGITDGILSGYTSSSKVKDDVNEAKAIATGRTSGVTVDSEKNGTYVHLTATTNEDKSVTLSISEQIVNVSAATATNNGFATACDIKAYVDAIEPAELTSRIQKLENTVSGTTSPATSGLTHYVAKNTADITTLNGDTGTTGSVAKQVKDAIDILKGGYNGTLNDIKGLADLAQSTADGAVGVNTIQDSKIESLENITSGFDEEQGAIKTYIDGKITSVYKYKGSVQTYNELTAKTQQEVGYVWNVEEACDHKGKHYSEGTNFACIDKIGDTGSTDAWDALGGTIDLSAYMKTETFNNWSSTTYNPTITSLQNSDDNLSSRISSLEAISGHTNASITGATALTTSESEQYLGASATTVSGKEAQLTYWAKIKNLVNATSSESGLADAWDVRNYIDSTASTLNSNINAVDDKVTTLSTKVGSGLTEGESITESLRAIKATADTAIQGVTAISKTDTYISAYTETSDKNVNVIISGNVCVNMDVEGLEQGQLADAKVVKNYVDIINTNLSSQIATTDERAKQGVNKVEFTGLTEISGVVTDENTQIKVRINPTSGETVAMQFDFSEMIINCGTYE